MIASGLLVVYAIIGFLYWLAMLYGTIRTVRGVPVLVDVPIEEPACWPSLALVVPACNEGEVLEPAILTLLKQDYPDLQLVLINDRSTDNTGAIVDRLAALDPRITPLHITHLPDGWLGKVHALSEGVKQSHSKWILFTDADVHMTASTLRRAVAYAEAHGLDHLAALPEMWPTTWPVNIIIASFFRIFATVMGCWAVADTRSKKFVGIGAFNLVRRSAFERTIGFEWLRLEVADDLGVGLLMKSSGFKPALVYGRDLIGLHWYRNLNEMAHGLEKAYASMAYCNPWRMLGQCAAMIAMEWAPVVVLVLGWPSPAFLTCGLVMLAVAVATTVFVSRWTRWSVWPGLFFPIGALVTAGLLLRSCWLGVRRGGAMWRGTVYTRKQLDAGRRVWLS